MRRVRKTALSAESTTDKDVKPHRPRRQGSEASATTWQTAGAFLFGRRYRYAPVSPLFLFGRHQDLALQRARDVIDERNHMRLWRAPVSLDGVPVWVGQISRDVGVKLTGRLWPPVTSPRLNGEDDPYFTDRLRLVW